jgi:thymidylate synthase (FAD)
MIDIRPRHARPSVLALDAILGYPTPVLDHGFVRVIDYMGDDAAIVQAARVSYGAGTKTPSEDSALIAYLMRHRHSTPFEMCEIKLHVKLPIFVARQWIRHRTASVNEYSARYSILDREFYIPRPEDILKQSSANKQGGGEPVAGEDAEAFRGTLTDVCAGAFDVYDNANSIDVARETARIGLPLSTYTQWYWKVDLHNLLNFLSLRADPHAQAEIRAYADVILDLVRQWVPATYAAFDEHRLGAVTFSRTAMRVLKTLIGCVVDKDEMGEADREMLMDLSVDLPRREREDFLRALGVPLT